MSRHTAHSQSDRMVRPLAEVWSLAWPTVVTMTSYTVMGFADKLMVAQVSPLQFAAQGNGGIWAFVPIVLVFGLVSVVNTYVSQHLGAGKAEEAPKYAWASFWMGSAIWVSVILPFALLLPWLFSLPVMGHSPEIIPLESGYGQILLVGSVVLVVSRGLNHFFFGLHRPRVVTYSALAGNVVNIVANYVLIFGHQGLPAAGLPGVPGVPAMGLYGAAIGTVMGTAVELIIPACIFLGAKMNAELATRKAWRPRWQPIRQLLRIGWPGAIQFANEVVCWAVFMTVLVGAFGEDHLAAGWATLSYMHLSFMPAVGFSVAVSSLVGKYIGAGQPDVALARTRLTLALSVGYMTACGLLMFLFREPLVAFFVKVSAEPEQAEQIVAIGSRLMICAAVFQTVDAFGIIYTGALRGAGDTVWPGMVTILYSWLFIVGAGWLIVTVLPRWESTGPWIAAAVFIIVFGLTMAWRFESGRWRSIKLLDDTPPRAATLVEPKAEPRLPEAAAAAPAPPVAPSVQGAEGAKEDLSTQPTDG